MKKTTTFSADGDQSIGKIIRPTHADYWVGTVFIYGDFGSGTATIQLSPDDGVTKITAKDQGGSDVTATSNDVRIIPVSGDGNHNGEVITLYANLNGATSPDLTIEVWDNR